MAVAVEAEAEAEARARPHLINGRRLQSDTTNQRDVVVALPIRLFSLFGFFQVILSHSPIHLLILLLFFFFFFFFFFLFPLG